MVRFKYHLILRRHHEVLGVKKQDAPAESACVGILDLFIEGERAFSCYTIENGGEPSDTPNQDKRIMPGIYYLRWDGTTVPLPPSHYKRGLLIDRAGDDSFDQRRIFFHMGNYPQDTKGCILLQGSYDLMNTPGYGGNSGRACLQFSSIIKKRTDLSELVFEIFEIPKYDPCYQVK